MGVEEKTGQVDVTTVTHVRRLCAQKGRRVLNSQDRVNGRGAYGDRGSVLTEDSGDVGEP